MLTMCPIGKELVCIFASKLSVFSAGPLGAAGFLLHAETFPQNNLESSADRGGGVACRTEDGQGHLWSFLLRCPAFPSVSPRVLTLLMLLFWALYPSECSVLFLVYSILAGWDFSLENLSFPVQSLFLLWFISSANGDILTFVLSCLCPFICFPSLSVLIKPRVLYWMRAEKVGTFVLILILVEMLQDFPPLNIMLAIGSSYLACFILKYIFSILSLFRTFSKKGY